jgi:excisionase family DNA binding protein
MENNRPQEMVADGLLTVKEASAFLKVSVATLYKLMERGELVYTKIGRSRRIPRKALVELAARNLVGNGNG